MALTPKQYCERMSELLVFFTVFVELMQLVGLYIPTFRIGVTALHTGLPTLSRGYLASRASRLNAYLHNTWFPIAYKLGPCVSRNGPQVLPSLLLASVRPMPVQLRDPGGSINPMTGPSDREQLAYRFIQTRCSMCASTSHVLDQELRDAANRRKHTATTSTSSAHTKYTIIQFTNNYAELDSPILAVLSDA